MNIGQAAKASGVSAKMIRHYESIGLIDQAHRTLSGYRTYTAADLHILRFIKQARTLGFSIEEIGKLLALWRNQERPSAEVKALAQAHIAALKTKIRELETMVGTLSHLAEHCSGDHRPECPILDALAEGIDQHRHAPGKECTCPEAGVEAVQPVDNRHAS